MPSTTLNNFDNTLADPWNAYGYSDWILDPFSIRREWMTLMGLSMEEIEEHCQPGQDLDVAEELEEYNAILEIQQFQGGTSGI